MIKKHNLSDGKRLEYPTEISIVHCRLNKILKNAMLNNLGELRQLQWYFYRLKI